MFTYTSRLWRACGLLLEAWSLNLIKKFLASFQISFWQLAMVLSEPWQQVVVIN